MTEEKVTLMLKTLASEAWRVETNTTLNAICEYIAREAIIRVVLPEVNALREEMDNLMAMLEDVANTEEENNASKDGGLSESQRNPQTSHKSAGRPAKARTANGANA